MEVEDAEGVRGVLISLLTLFDTNGNRTLTKEEYKNAAGSLGFDTGDAAWEALCRRFGDKNNQQSSTTEEMVEHAFLDLNLLGSYFANKYDRLLEEILRRVVGGIINSNTRSATLEARMEKMEAHLEMTSMREERERTARVNQTLRRWKHKYTSVAFDGWKNYVVNTRARLQSSFRHWTNTALSLCWRRWKDMIQEVHDQRSSAQRVLGRWRLRFVAQTFTAWATSVREVREERERKMKRTAAALMNTSVARAFRNWAANSVKGRKTLDFQRKILLRLHHGALFDVYSAWAAYVSNEIARRAALVKRTGMRIAYATLFKTYDCWKLFTRQVIEEREDREQKALQMAGRWFSPMVGRCYDAWLSHTAAVVEIKRRAAFAMGPGRLLHISMRTWAHNVREQKRQAERAWVEAVIKESVPGMIATTIERELSLIAESKQGAQDDLSATIKAANAALQSELDGLRREMEAASERRIREKQITASRVVRQWKNQIASRAFNAWQSYLAETKELLRSAMVHWRIVPLRHAMYEWYTITLYINALRKSAHIISASMQRRLALQIMHAWRHETVQAMDVRKTGSLRAVVLWTNRAHAGFFYPWQAYARKSLYIKSMAAAAVKRILNATLATAFNTLALHVQEKVQARTAMLKNAVTRMRDTTRRLAFVAWQQEARKRIASRNNNYLRAASRLLNRQKAQLFDAWRDFVERKAFILRRAAYYFGEGHVLATMYGRWRELWEHAASIKKTQWLLQDLKLVGKGWLVETLDQVLSTSLPLNTQLDTYIARAVLGHGVGMAAKEPEPSPAAIAPVAQPSATELPPPKPPAPEPPPPEQLSAEMLLPAAMSSTTSVVISGDIVLDVSTPRSEATPRFVIDVTEHVEPTRMPPVPQPPGVPRANPPPPRRGAGMAPAQPHQGSTASLARAASPELVPEQPVLLPLPAAMLSTTGSEPRSTALHALGAFLDGQQRTNDLALRRLVDAQVDARDAAHMDTERLGSELLGLRNLLLDHARIAFAEASKRQADAVQLDGRVTQLTGQLANMEEHVAYLKDMLYSVLTSGPGGPITPRAKPPPSKKMLKPIQQTRPTPWSAA